MLSVVATQVGTAHIHGLTGGTLTITDLSGYVSPNMQSLRVTNGAQIDRIKNQSGDTSGLIASDEMVECEFDFIPEDTTSTFLAIADAKKVAGLPSALAGVGVTGLPIIACGPFSDVMNTDAGNTQPWIYEGGGTLNGPHDGKWTLTMPLKRYPSITVATVAA